jgi:hypothetical protein
MLEQALELKMPCVHRHQYDTHETNATERSGHQFTVHGTSGAGSGYWTNELQTNAKLRSDIRRADLVLFDTTVNDVGAKEGGFVANTETLVWIVERLAPDAMKMWVTAGWRGFDNPFTTTVENAEREVLATYGIPHISLMTGLLVPRNCVLESNKSSTSCTELFKPGFTKKFIIPNYDNCCHPGELGSQLTATFIARYLIRLRDEEAAGKPVPFPRTPRWVDAAKLEAVLHPKTMIVDLKLITKRALLNEHVLKHDGFEVYEDAKGKPGLIATAVGAQFIAGFHIDVPRGFPVIVAVTLLSTYANVGVANILLQTKETKETTKQWVTRASKAVDCLWSEHVSEPVVHRFEWTPPARPLSWPAMDARVVVEVGLRATQTGGTKVKIYSVEVSTLS